MQVIATEKRYYSYVTYVIDFIDLVPAGQTCCIMSQKKRYSRETAARNISSVKAKKEAR